MANATNYWEYLHLDELLSLQGGLEGDDDKLMPDELHFIIVHQVFELWFKLIIRELRMARDHLSVPQVPEEHIPLVFYHLGRVNAIARLLVEQFAVMETLTPQDFLDFRDKLMPASGFQSHQMRELEILLGLEPENRERLGPNDVVKALKIMSDESPMGTQHWSNTVGAAQREQSLRDALLEWLYRTPIQGSSPDDPGDDEVVMQFVRQYIDAQHAMLDEQSVRLQEVQHIETAESVARRFAQSKEQGEEFLFANDVAEQDRARVRRVRAGLLFIESYRELPLLAWPRLLIDAVVELEEQLVLFRTRHARMVERIIGRRIGTGGSSGVDYLDKTTKYRIFSELWTVRTILLPRHALPPLRGAGFYGFRAE